MYFNFSQLHERKLKILKHINHIWDIIVVTSHISAIDL